jgi:alkyl sulfatase BDS1-like metallo-beta-lactamase superfamily hydrolase
VTLTQPQLLAVLTGKDAQDAAMEGDTSALDRLMGVLDNPDPAFPIVTP